jgi:pilus assembly protein Flp/PilA
MSKLFAFLKDESGATAIEYGLIAAGVSVVIIATVNAIGSTLNGKFSHFHKLKWDLLTGPNRRRGGSFRPRRKPTGIAAAQLR